MAASGGSLGAFAIKETMWSRRKVLEPWEARSKTLMVVLVLFGVVRSLFCTCRVETAFRAHNFNFPVPPKKQTSVVEDARILLLSACQIGKVG